jgi:multisubunit Na+/H+ antiporter MnhE subunit
MRFTYLVFALTWISQLVLWLAFADSIGIRELAIGATVAGAATLATALFRRHTNERYRFRPLYLRQFVHVPKTIAVDTGVLLRAVVMCLLGRRVPANIVAVPFRVGGNGPSSHGRRALSLTYLTLAPNTIVLGFWPERQLLIFHSVLPRPLPKFALRMGAHPNRRGQQ